MRGTPARDGQTVRRLDGRWLPPRLAVYPSIRLAVSLVGVALLLAACGGSQGPTPVVVYSPHGRDLLAGKWLDRGSESLELMHG